LAVTASTRDFRPTVFVLRALGLGDLLTIVPAWRALERAFRGYRRLVAAPRLLAPIVELLAAEHVPLGGLEPVAAGPVSVAVNLHGSGPESDEVLLALRPADLLAYAHPRVPATRTGPAWDPDEHEVERWCRLLRAHGIGADPWELDLPAPRPIDVARARAVAGIVDDETTVIHPGAATGGRRWPAERFARVARAEARAGRRVVVTGTADEVALATQVVIESELPSDALLAGRTDVGALMAIVARAGCVVCGDTGVAHLATATRTPSVVIFGPTSPDTWGPPQARQWHRALWAGAVSDPHARSPAAGLLAISVADVTRALDDLRASTPRRVQTPVGTGSG
jgi:ADP-heptose:LPS heptosyltransferase